MSERVGILTFHHTTNYGATLQAWALQKRLRELGVMNEIIDYRPIKARMAYRRALFFNQRFIQGIRKAFSFADFRRNHLKLSSHPITELDALPAIVAKYSTVICGSDEVWNTASFRGYDPGFFLPFPSTAHVRKCSYAASAGSTLGFGNKKEEISAAIKSFTSLSVRDQVTQNLLSAECGVKAERVVDPTLLVEFDELMLDTSPCRKPYILIYGSLGDGEQKVVTARASQMRCRIISVGEFNRCADVNLVHAGIPLWLSLIRDAEMVFTGFFHGAIFAWKFDRPLIVFQRPDKTRKIEGFVEDLALLANDASFDGIQAIQYSSSADTAWLHNAAKVKADRFLRMCIE